MCSWLRNSAGLLGVLTGGESGAGGGVGLEARAGQEPALRAALGETLNPSVLQSHL